MKMAQALLELDPNLLTITARGTKNYSKDEIKSFYGLTTNPEITRFPASGRIGIHKFNLRAAFLARRVGAKRVLSRSIGAAALTARLKIPTIYECHAPPQGFEKKYWNILFKSKDFLRLAVISNALREIMFKTFPETANIDVVVAHDGVDLDRFRDLKDARTAKQEAGRNPDQLIAGYAGHLYAGRGIELILTCAQSLSDWKFVIVGGTDEDVRHYTDQAMQRGLNNIEFWGFVPNGALAEKLAIADVLLMPYQKSVAVSGGNLDTAQWMSPLKMFEYMAMKRAIIASDLPVLREVLDDQTAVIVKPDDAGEWVQALLMLETDSSRTRFSDAAVKSAACYDWRNRAKQILDL